MDKFFGTCLILYYLQYLFRIFLALMYFKKNNKCIIAKEEKDFCIVQAILSGDSMLESNLEKNLENFSKITFIWIIDKNDIEANKLAKKFQEKYQNIIIILADKIPQNVNPKTYKLNLAIPYLKKYCIFLDDDCVINNKYLEKFYNILNEEKCVINTIPYYKSTNFLGDLLSSSANANSVLFYLPTAYMNDMKTISGMCYITTKEVIVSTNVFKETEKCLFDDLAFYDVCEKNDIKVYQSVMPNINCINVVSLKQFIKIYKRWTAFANMHMKKYLNFFKFMIIVFAMCIPCILFFISISLGVKYFIFLIITCIFKAFITKYIRHFILDVKEKNKVIFYEILIDFLQAFIEIYTIIDKNKIEWRNKSIKIKGKDFIYEEIK